MVTISKVLALALLSLGLTATPGFAQSACRPADQASDRMVLWVKGIATGTDGQAASSRTMMKIPFVASSEISHVTDSLVCNNALGPYNSKAQLQVAATGTPVPSSGQLYVVKVGTVYVVWDPVKSAGSYALYVTMNASYQVLWNGIG